MDPRGVNNQAAGLPGPDRIPKSGDKVGDYVLGEFLGEGSIARVFAATHQKTGEEAVVKFLRRPDRAEDLADFRQEGIVLDALARAETVRGDGLKLVPRVRDAKLVDGERHYIITDRARGRGANLLLAKGEPLDEPTVLRIGWQFCRVLDLLHTELQRSYTDLKLENIWWDEHAGQIWVTDWNVVSKPGEADAQTDLDRFARLLFWMLTGVSPEYLSERRMGGQRKGIGEETLIERGGEPWQALTYGARQVLVDALVTAHISEPPYPSAKALGDRLRWLADAWGENWPALLADAQRKDRTPQDARALLEIAARKGGDVQKPLDVVEGKLASTSRLDRAKSFLESQNAAEAVRLATDEAEWGRDRLRGLRWLYMARAAQAGFSHFRESSSRVFAGLEHLDEGRFQSARAEFARLSYELADPAGATDRKEFGRLPLGRLGPGAREYGCLARDAAICDHLQSAERHELAREYEPAMDALRLAAEQIQDLQTIAPEYADLLRQRRGDPLTLLEDLRVWTETVIASKRHVDAASKAETPAEVAVEIELALRRNRDNQQALHMCQTKAREQVGKGDLEAALLIAESGLQFVPGDPTLNAIAKSSLLLSKAQQALSVPDGARSLAWKMVLDNVDTALEMPGGDARLRDAVDARAQELLRQLVLFAAPSKDTQLMAALEEMLARRFPQGSPLRQEAEKLRLRRESLAQQSYQALVQRCEQALDSDAPDEVGEVLDRARAFANSLQEDAAWAQGLPSLVEQLESHASALEYRQVQEERLKEAATLLADASTPGEFGAVEAILHDAEGEPLTGALRRQVKELRQHLDLARQNADQVQLLSRDLAKIRNLLQELATMPALQNVADQKALRLQAWQHCQAILKLHPGHELATEVLAEIGKGLYQQDVLLMGAYEPGAASPLPDVTQEIDELEKRFRNGELPEVPDGLEDTMARLTPLGADLARFATLQGQLDLAKRLHDAVEQIGQHDAGALQEIEPLLDAELPQAQWEMAVRGLSQHMHRCLEAIRRANARGDDAEMGRAIEEALRMKQMFALAAERAGEIKGLDEPKFWKRLKPEKFAEQFAKSLAEEGKEA